MGIDFNKTLKTNDYYSKVDSFSDSGKKLGLWSDCELEAIKIYFNPNVIIVPVSKSLFITLYYCGGFSKEVISVREFDKFISTPSKIANQDILGINDVQVYASAGEFTRYIVPEHFSHTVYDTVCSFLGVIGFAQNDKKIEFCKKCSQAFLPK